MELTSTLSISIISLLCPAQHEMMKMSEAGNVKDNVTKEVKVGNSTKLC